VNLLIVGASGGTGLHLVDQALQRGHRVTAFVRDPARLHRSHAALHWVTGDALQPASIEPAMSGQDAVLCALGTMPESKADRKRRQPGVPVCSLGTQNIVQAMIRYAVTRIVAETSAQRGR
jgi:uncharacterized protein YbjT (DUF2867 family)